MPTIRGLTAERMNEIMEDVIVSADVDEFGHLILTKFGGGTVDAGSVIGPQGIQGIPGPVNLLNELDDVNTAGADVSEALVFDGTNWVPGAPTLPTPQQVGGLIGSTEGGFQTVYSTNSSTYTEVNGSARVSFVVPPSGKVVVHLEADVEVQTGPGAGGGFGFSRTNLIGTPLRVAPWGATAASLSNPATQMRLHYSLTEKITAVAPYWSPGDTVEFTPVAFKQYGPSGGSNATLITVRMQIFAVV